MFQKVRAIEIFLNSESLIHVLANALFIFVILYVFHRKQTTFLTLITVTNSASFGRCIVYSVGDFYTSESASNCESAKYYVKYRGKTSVCVEICHEMVPGDFFI